MTSEEMARAFYDQLGAAALAARTTAAWDQQIVARVLQMFRPSQRVLDIGCGYGRIAVPVAVGGYQVVGLDISPRLLAAAWEQGHVQGVTMMWLQASMCRMPLSTNTCDIALCLWSAFYELLVSDEQLATVREIVRVLLPGGWGLVEGSPYESATVDDLRHRYATICWRPASICASSRTIWDTTHPPPPPSIHISRSKPTPWHVMPSQIS